MSGTILLSHIDCCCVCVAVALTKKCDSVTNWPAVDVRHQLDVDHGVVWIRVRGIRPVGLKRRRVSDVTGGQVHNPHITRCTTQKIWPLL